MFKRFLAEEAYMNRAGQLTRCDAVVILVCVLLLAMVAYATNGNMSELARRVRCGTNLKGLGTAQAVYANDYDDAFVVAGGGGNNPWAKKTLGWYDPSKDWSGDDDVTVGASLYLLVREADVSPKSLVCPSSMQTLFDGSNPNNLDLVELWDFGSVDYQNTGPKNCVSYSYQHPFGRFAADGTKSASFAVMADRNPWYDSTIRKGPASADDWFDKVGYLGRHYAGPVEEWQIKVANAQPHLREGQNVVFGDGHSAYEQYPDIGVKHDNLFTPRGPGAGTEDDIRIGQMPDPYGIGYGEPYGSGDSFLVNDDEINPCFADQPGDVNGDCNVDFKDLAILSENWMESTKVED